MNLNINSFDHTWGNPEASLVLVEYADFQCPYCGQADRILKEIKKQLENDMLFVFRNFPLAEIHPYAVHAAVSAEAAGKQDKFWEMHDVLFENQKRLDDDHLFKYAEQIGLDIQKFEQDLETDSCTQKVEKDYESGMKQGVQGTPTFFVNGKLFEGNWMHPSFIGYLRTFIK